MINWGEFLREDKMAEMTVEQIIKLIIGVFVIVAVVVGATLIFKDKIFGQFDLISENDTLIPNLFLGIICK